MAVKYFRTLLMCNLCDESCIMYMNGSLCAEKGDNYHYKP